MSDINEYEDIPDPDPVVYKGPIVFDPEIPANITAEFDDLTESVREAKAMFKLSIQDRGDVRMIVKYRRKLTKAAMLIAKIKKLSLELRDDILSKRPRSRFPAYHSKNRKKSSV